MINSNDFIYPDEPWMWHEGPSIEDANGIWWDVSFEDFGTYLVHRETGSRMQIAESSRSGVDHRIHAIETRLTNIEANLELNRKV